MLRVGVMTRIWWLLQPPGLKSGHFEIAVATYAQHFSRQVDKAIDLRLGRRWPRSGVEVWPHCCNTLALQPHVLNAGCRFRGVREERPHKKDFLKHLCHTALEGSSVALSKEKRKGGD